MLIAAVLILAGAGLIVYALWELQRLVHLMRVGSGSAPDFKRLEAIAAEIVSAAEAVSDDLDQRTERLSELLRLADERLATMRTSLVAHAPAAAPAHVESPVPLPVVRPTSEAAPGVPVLYRQVYDMADAGQETEVIAREMKITRGEVQLILGLRRLN